MNNTIQSVKNNSFLKGIKFYAPKSEYQKIVRILNKDGEQRAREYYSNYLARVEMNHR